jgi:hypothetical protein
VALASMLTTAGTPVPLPGHDLDPARTPRAAAAVHSGDPVGSTLTG